MRQINLSSQGQERSIDFGLLSTDAAMSVLAMKPVEEFVQGASSLAVTPGSSFAALSLDGPFLFEDSALYSDIESRLVNKGKFAYRSTDLVHEKAKVVLLNAADKTPIQDSQGKELVAFLRVDVGASTTRLEFHVDNGNGTYSSAVVPAGVTSVLYQFLQRFSFDEVRPEVASTKKFFHGVVDVAVDNDLNQLLKDVYGPTGSFNGTGQAALGSGQSVVERLDDLVVDLAAETTDRQSEDALLQSAITAEETRAMAEEADIRADFAAADSALETSLGALIDAEETRAMAAESALSGAIQSLSGSSGSSLSTLQAELDAEEARAMAEEADIRLDFAAADASLQNTLQTNINAEQSRALAAESALDARLDTLEAADTVSGSVANSVKTERLRALAAEAALSGDITNLGFDLSSEVSRALTAEAALQSAVDAEETRAMAEEADIRADFAAADASTLSSAQSYTNQKISDLVNGAPVLLDTLKEIADQLAADESVAAALANTVASNLVEAKAYTDTEVAAEETRALAAESALDARLDILEGPDTLSGSVAHAVKAEETRALAAEASLAADIASEQTRALAAEAGLDARLDTLEANDTVSGSVAYQVKVENTRALAAEAVLQSNINTEASARVSGDSNLQSQVNSLLSSLNAYKALVGKPVDMETVTFAADGSYVLQQAPSGLVSGSKPMLAINGVLQEIGGTSPDFSIVADATGVVRKVQLVLGNKTVSGILGPNGTAVIWYRAVI